MSIRDLITMALKNLWKRKLRTFLTVLGVIIGTTSIVVMVSIGIGMNESFQKQVEEWGSLQVIDVYGENNDMIMMDEKPTKKPQKGVSLDSKALDTFRKMNYVEVVSPIVQRYEFLLIDGKYVNSPNFIGIDPSAMEALGYKIEEGRALTAEDEEGLVVGRNVIEGFYNPKMSWQMQQQTSAPELNIMEDKIMISADNDYGTKYAEKSIKPMKTSVVGVMPDSGMNGYSVIMPLKQMEKLQKDLEALRKKQNNGYKDDRAKKKGVYEQVAVKVSDINKVQEVQQQIKDMGFRTSSLTDELNTMKETTKMLRMMLGAIGAVSLVVAAIGITNTMVMAIYERTREIGIMKVIGASLRDVKLLFLTEAAFIGFVGGVLGCVTSFLMSKVVNLFAAQQASEMTSSIPIWLYLAAIGFATAIGVLSGYLPAQRAMKLSALTAIKTE